MDLSKLTDCVRKVMAMANQEAQRFNHDYIGTEHILLGLVKEGSGVGANLLKNLGIDLRKVRIEIERLVGRGPDMVMMGRLPLTSQAKSALSYAFSECEILGEERVSSEHLWRGLLREADGTAAQVLAKLGVSIKSVAIQEADRHSAGNNPKSVSRPKSSIEFVVMPDTHPSDVVTQFSLALDLLGVKVAIDPDSDFLGDTIKIGLCEDLGFNGIVCADAMELKSRIGLAAAAVANPFLHLLYVEKEGLIDCKLTDSHKHSMVSRFVLFTIHEPREEVDELLDWLDNFDHQLRSRLDQKDE